MDGQDGQDGRGGGWPRGAALTPRPPLQHLERGWRAWNRPSEWPWMPARERRRGPAGAGMTDEPVGMTGRWGQHGAPIRKNLPLSALRRRTGGTDRLHAATATGPPHDRGMVFALSWGVLRGGWPEWGLWSYVSKAALTGQVKPGSTSRPSRVSWSVSVTTAWPGRYTSTLRVCGRTTQTRRTS